MKHFLLLSLMLILSSCAHKVLVRKSSCEDVVSDLMKCEEIK